jgi:hypothetical protein
VSKFTDLLGTLGSSFRIGLAGVRLKNLAGNLALRNSGDTADAALTASSVNVSGDAIVLNSDAAGTGTDYSATVQRNAAATAAITVMLPPSKGTDGQVLRQKAGTAAGVIELEFATAGTTSQCVTSDETDLAFGSASPVAMFTLPANAVVDRILCHVDTAFDGAAPSASIGVSGQTSKYMSATDMDLKTVGQYEVHPGLVASGSSEDLIITFNPDSSTAGAGRFEVFYAIPV